MLKISLIFHRSICRKKSLSLAQIKKKKWKLNLKSDKEIWNFRNPKKSSKYNPDEMEDA